MASKMKVSDVIAFRGALEFALMDRGGKVIERGRQVNSVVTVGRALILKRIGSNDAHVIDTLYLGKSDQTPATGLTALSQSFSSKVVGTSSTAGCTANPPYATFAASWASNETHASSSAIKEFGLYMSDTMLGYLTTATAINFSSTNTLAITYTLSN